MQLYSLCVSQSFEKSLLPDIIEMEKFEWNDLITNTDFIFEKKTSLKFGLFDKNTYFEKKLSHGFDVY